MGAVESLDGMVALRTNTSSAVLYAIERDAGIGWLPSYALVFGGRFVPVDIGVMHSLENLDDVSSHIRNSERHMVVVDLVAQISFDARRFPCFREEFIHPLGLVPMMADVAENHGGRGFLAADPTGQSSGAPHQMASAFSASGQVQRAAVDPRAQRRELSFSVDDAGANRPCVQGRIVKLKVNFK